MSERVDQYLKGESKPPRKPRFNAFQPLLIAVVLVVGVFLGASLKNGSIFTFEKEAASSNPNKLVDVINKIEATYVDSVHKQDLIDDAINAILDELDPHSFYISPEEFSAMNEQMQGGFEGIGVEFLIEEDTLVVVNPLTGGPSERAGILPGDQIIMVDDSLITHEGLANQEVMSRLKGRSGTPVKLSIKRRGESELLDFNIKRERIPIYSVVADYVDENDIGYVKVTQFARNTYEEFTSAVNGLRDQGAKKLIIDLRGNGGGYLDAATNIVEEFLEKNQLIVFTEGRRQGRENTFSTRRGTFRDMEVTVLMNQTSASASEVVAGALQDHDRSITIGRRSFGKGLVQNQFTMDDNSALRITIARYYTPSGRCIQKPYGEGIDYEDDLNDRYESGELVSADSIAYADSLRFVTPEGRVVFGGGGITPDIFVPLDTLGNSFYLSELRYNGVFRSWTLNYSNDHVDELGAYGDMKAFDAGFEISANMVESIQAFAEKKEIESVELSGESLEDLKRRMKAYIAKHTFDENAYYYVMRTGDEDYLKAIEVLGDYKRYFNESLAANQQKADLVR